MSETLKNIIVPVDFSDHSVNSIDEAILLSKLTQSKIHLLNIIEFNDWWNSLIINKEIKDKLTELAQLNLKKLTESYPEVHFEMAILFGKRHEQILSYSESVKANFILLYDKHKDENESKIIGSTVTRIITKSKCPVITIKNKVVSEINKIIVPVDLSDKTEAQILSAIEFSKKTNARLHLVSVLFKGFGTKNLRIKAKAQRLRSTLKEYNIPFTISLIKKHNAYAYQDILDFSDKQNADLIIIMTHKENYGFDNYIGAFAQQIINYSKVPVMTITSEATRSETGAIINNFVDPLGIYDREDTI